MAALDKQSPAPLPSTDRAAVLAAWAGAVPLPPGAAVPAYAEAWLDGLLEMSAAGTDRTAGWVARLVEGARGDGHGPDWVLALLWGLRRALQSRTLDAAPGKTDPPRIGLCDIIDRHALHLTQYCVQSEREAHLAAQRRLRTLADSVDVPFAVLDTEGVVTLANTVLAQTLGVGVDMLLGGELARFCDEDAAAELRRCFRQKRAAPCRQFSGAVAGPNQPQSRMRFNVRPLFDAAGLRDGWAVSLDPLEIRGEDVAQYLQAVFDQVADAIRAGLQVVHRDGRVAYENPLCRALLASPESGERRLCCHLLLHRAGRSACICGQVVASGETFAEELSLAGEDTTRWYNLVVVPLRDGRGDIVQWATIFRDVTAQRQLEARVLDQQRSSLVSQVAVSVAHQLRNPLAVMLGFAEMLEAGLSPDKLPMVADRLLRNAMRCKQIVEDVLEFGHGQPGARKPIALERVLRDLVQPLYAQHRERIDWEIAEALGPVACVPAQLTQVFASLLDNALRAAKDRVKVRAWRENGSLLVCVRDDGPGVPPDLHGRIFLPFFTTRKQEEAVGLGLSLSQSVVSEYGGQLTLEADFKGGASFLVRLPVARETADTPEERAERRRILIVDDELDLLEMLGTAMELQGYEVDMAGSASEALPLLDRHTYHGAVFDVQLPGVLGGPDLYAHALRAQPALSTRTLFITADTMNFETQRFLERVRRPSMEKPFLVSEFVGRMERLLSEGPLATGTPENH